MKSFPLLLLCLALGIFAGSACALDTPAADAGDLFGAAATLGIEDSQPVAAGTPPAVSQAPTPGYAARAQWQDDENSPSVLNAAGEVKPQDAQRETAPSSPITVVPEPSAVILALAALVYFLLFGRRRAV